MKREVAKRFVENFEQMKRLVSKVLRRIQRLPELVRSFFRQPECQYILE